MKGLVASGHKVVGVIAPGSRIADEALANAAEEAKVPLTHIDNVNSDDALEFLSSLKPDLGIIGGFSTIFKTPLINLPRYGTINLHAGRVPEYRGGSPLNWQIINGERDGYISVLKVDEGIDSGELLGEKRFPIDESDTIVEAHEKANALFPVLVLDVLSELKKNGRLQGESQDHSKAVYWHQRSESDGHILWRDLTARNVYDFVRALTRPYPGAYSYYKGEKIRIHTVSIPSHDICGVPGRIIYVQGSGPYVICRDKAVFLEAYEWASGVDKLSLRHGGRFE